MYMKKEITVKRAVKALPTDARDTKKCIHREIVSDVN